MGFTNPTALARRARAIFRTDTPGAKPDLVDLGLDSLRSTVGGVFPGNLVVLGAATNVGKSSLLLEMVHQSTSRGAILSREDDVDILGTRLLARWAGVPEVRIRTNVLTDLERVSLSEAQRALDDQEAAGLSPLIAVPSECRTLDDVEHLLDEAQEAGAKWVALDFLQKYRGISDNRRQEIGIILDRYQASCRQRGLVAVLVSQVARIGRYVRPNLGMLKESGDIENEAKLILLAWLNHASPSQMLVEVAKSSFGGGGTMLSLRYDACGVLREEGLVGHVEEYVPPEDGDALPI